MHLFGPVHSVHPPFSWFARPARPGGSVELGSESTACVKWSATGLGSLGLPPIELHADCRPLHTDVHCFATGLGSLGLPPNELHVVCKTMYTTAVTEAHSLPVPCHDGSTVLVVQGAQGEALYPRLGVRFPCSS